MANSQAVPELALIALNNRTKVALFVRKCVCLLVVIAAADGFAVADGVDFNRDIRPLLSDRCFHCHGRDVEHRQAELRLDQADGAEGAYRTLDDSAAIVPGNLAASGLWHRISTDDEYERMPPVDSNKKPLTAEEQELFRQWILQGAEYQQLWSYVAPANPPLPEVKDVAWRNGNIDPFVKFRLEQEGVQPKSLADKRTLIRRVTFDLTGLPPSLDEVHKFIEDDSPDAYEKLIDRLLATPAYGEHMARYWADLVRLADTNGMHKDFYRNFSAYRTWLIRAFNDNLSFDDFVTYQLAGDLYENPNQDQLIASGFNRLHLIIDRGTALPEESLHNNIVDRVTAFGTTFLGLTVQCAQCHDHKYDPISQKEYFQLYAFFNNFAGEPETEKRPPQGISPPSIALGPTADDPNVVVPQAMVMQERNEPRPTYLLERGSYEDHSGVLVQRNTPAFLPPMKQKTGMYTRMDLAEWLVDPAHPLTARVAVNRIWQQFFGVGLVKTSEDFGYQGQWPSHPELLDSLTTNFIESGWDVKALVRGIVLSRTYRQSSDATPDEYSNDPENRLLARGPRYRMDAEMIRDQVLFVSGQLNREMYGESVKPPQPPGLWEAVSMAAPFTYVADTGDDIYRRSFYTYWRRGMPPPQMTILNAPSREFCTARRERTNTPLQALLLMNEQEYFAAAKRCATNLLDETEPDATKRLSLLYEQITSQLPDERQLQQMKETLDGFHKIYSANVELTEALTPDLAEAEYKHRVEISAWTMMAHSLLNLELTKVKR